MADNYYDINGNIITTLYDILGNIIKSKKRYKTFSVLADSYGAFQNHTDPLTNVHYYPSADVTDHTQMWWYLFGQSYGCTLDRCNAFSGSRIADDPKWFQGIEQCYITRSKNLGNPDLILVLGGTNDVWNSIPLGDYKYSNWTDSDKQTFRGACSCLIDGMKKQYPNADIYFLCNTIALSATNNFPVAHEYYLSMHEVCKHYNIP